jgi:alkanesulfonate monooxygenase SsuD/methylene tetrahydromethanopterin reductase-like flavin-dependent oxidoreductase (luciferase family)
MSVLAFASDDEQARREFEAAWALTMRNLARGVREPLRPEEVQQHARSVAFAGAEMDNARMVVGEPKIVVERLLELKAAAQADEIVVVTPGLGRTRRADSFTAIADGWRSAA